MILLFLLIIPFAGGLLAWVAAAWSKTASRWVALATLLLELGLTAYAWSLEPRAVASVGFGSWRAELRWAWIPPIGSSFHLAADGLSLLLVMLSAFLGIMAVITSWTEVKERIGFFNFNLLWTISAMIGVFLALDLFLFYVMWELMLIPMFLIIALWGREGRGSAAIKFFIYTQASGLFMLLSIIGVYFLNGSSTGVYTFDYVSLIANSSLPKTAWWLVIGFFIAFAVKLGVVPLHGWLPDAYASAPSAGSLLLAGLMAKTGAYGLIRFAVPLFPMQSPGFRLAAMILGVVSILYGAVLAFSQTDLKRLIAYSSISHMGFVLLGVFVWNGLSLQGVVVQLISHGVSIGALFMLAGAIYERTGTTALDAMGGFWAGAPRMGLVMLLFSLASMGLPGLGNFIGEFLILLGAFRQSIPIAAIAAIGVIFSVIYALWMMQRVFQGPVRERRFADLCGREGVALAIMTAAIIGIGVYPRPIIATSAPALPALQRLPSMPAAQSMVRERGSHREGTNDAP